VKDNSGELTGIYWVGKCDSVYAGLWVDSLKVRYFEGSLFRRYLNPNHNPNPTNPTNPTNTTNPTIPTKLY